MQDLEQEERDIIDILEEYYPYTSVDIKQIFLNVNKSYDKTIYIMTKAMQLGLHPDDLY